MNARNIISGAPGAAVVKGFPDTDDGNRKLLCTAFGEKWGTLIYDFMKNDGDTLYNLSTLKWAGLNEGPVLRIGVMVEGPRDRFNRVRKFYDYDLTFKKSDLDIGVCAPVKELVGEV